MDEGVGGGVLSDSRVQLKRDNDNKVTIQNPAKDQAFPGLLGRVTTPNLWLDTKPSLNISCDTH